MQVQGDVVVESEEQKIETDELIWHDEMEKFFTDSYVTVSRKDRNTVIEGKGLIANADLSNVVIEKMIKTTIKDPGSIDREKSIK